MHKLRPSLLIKLIVAGIALIITWQIAMADAHLRSIPTYPQQAQARKLTSLLLASEAERAMVSYVPNQGLIVALDLIRGPNSLRTKTSEEGTLDWIVFLLGNIIGPELGELAAEETVTVTVDFYDYHHEQFRQLVVVTSFETYADGNSYDVWLDGVPYAAEFVVDALPESAPATATPDLVAEVDWDSVAAFSESAASEQWSPISGDWSFIDGNYVQTDAVNFDRISFFNRPVTNVFTITTRIQYRAGIMAGGIVFNAPDPQFRANSHMASYSSNGSFFQWGFFSTSGDFVYQGGAAVEGAQRGNDGEWHELTIIVKTTAYTIILDGEEIGSNIPLVQAGGGYFGLFSSTSQVAFQSVDIDGEFR